MEPSKDASAGFSPIEEIIALALIAIFIAVIYERYKAIELRAKIEVTKSDLKNLRLAVQLFRIRKGRFPGTLYELYRSGYLRGMLQKSEFRKTVLLDPFGNPYIYDNSTGSVRLSSETERIINGEKIP